MFGKIKNINILSPQETILCLYSRLSKTDKLALFYSFVFWIIAHLFMFTNDFFIYDSVNLFDYSTGLQNGRFLIGPILKLFANCQIPWVIGIVSGILVSLSVMFICRLFNVTNKFYILLLSATVVTFPVLYATNLFLSSVYIYSLALLTSVLSIYLLKKETILRYLFSGILIFISLACYQAYMPFAVCLLLLSLIFDALENKDILKIIKKLIITGMVFMIAAALYYCTWSILMDIFDISPYNYRGENNVASSLFSLGIFERILRAYRWGVLFIFKGLFYYGNTPLMVVGKTIKFFIAIFFIASVFIFMEIKKPTFNNILVTYVLLFALPLGVGLIYVFSPFVPHSLMQFPVISVYIGIIAIFQKLLDENHVLKKHGERIAVLLLCISILINVVCGNAGYSLNSSSSKTSFSFVSQVVDRIESTAGIDVGTKVCFVSDEFWYCYDYGEDEFEEKTKTLNGQKAKDAFYAFTVTPAVNVGVPYVDVLINYINDNANYMELEYSYQDLQDGDYANNKQVQELKPFPAKNCSVWVNDTLVIRL